MEENIYVDYPEAVLWFRAHYGIFEEELIEKAGLEVDVAGLREFEEGNLKALKETDLEKIINYSPLPRGYFDGSLKEAWIKVFNLLDAGKPIPEDLREKGKIFISLWNLSHWRKFYRLMGMYHPYRFEEKYPVAVACAELYDIIIKHNIKNRRLLDLTDIGLLIEHTKGKWASKDLSNGKMLEIWLRMRIGARGPNPKEFSLKLFGDETSIYDLFKEHRFDKSTLKKLNSGFKQFRFRITTYKNYIWDYVYPTEAYKMYIDDQTVNNPSKKILPPAEIFFPYNKFAITTLYFYIKGNT